MGDIFYQRNILTIGGVETFLFEISKMYGNRDITIYYSDGDAEQIKRLRQYAKTVRYTGQKIKCRRAFFNYAVDIIDNVDAEEYVQLIHADFKDKSLAGYQVVQNNRIDRYIAVSENNKKSFEELAGRTCEVAYNPITIEPPPRIMRLISAQRLTPEKGGKRLEEMIRRLDASGIPYEWNIFSTDRLSVVSENVNYKKPTLDIRKHIANADYMVLLSDTEGFSYGIYEALLLGVPVIVTKIKVIEEVGIQDGINGFVVDFDLKNLNLGLIYRNAGKLKFNYEKKPNRWNELITSEITNYQENRRMMRRVKATNKYKELQVVDALLGRIPEEGEIFEVSQERFDVLTTDNPYKAIFVAAIDEPKEETVAEESKPKKKSTKKNA